MNYKTQLCRILARQRYIECEAPTQALTKIFSLASAICAAVAHVHGNDMIFVLIFTIYVMIINASSAIDRFGWPETFQENHVMIATWR
jgi:hypothetical protein